MKAREMYAPKGWDGFPCFSLTARKEQEFTYPVRVLVQETPEGMPRLAPKDRVRHVGTLEEMEVTSRPFWSDFHGEWRVEVSKADYHYATVGCKNLALRPRETSRLIRVTGPEDGVESVTKLAQGKVTAANLPPGVRVEVVDEDA